MKRYVAEYYCRNVISAFAAGAFYESVGIAYVQACMYFAMNLLR